MNFYWSSENTFELKTHKYINPLTLLYTGHIVVASLKIILNNIWIGKHIQLKSWSQYQQVSIQNIANTYLLDRGLIKET